MTVECAIPQKFHRSVMGPKGSRIQQITRDYNVQIKFPDKEENPGGSPGGALSWVGGGSVNGPSLGRGVGKWPSCVLVKLHLAWGWTCRGPGLPEAPAPWSPGGGASVPLG